MIDSDALAIAYLLCNGDTRYAQTANVPLEVALSVPGAYMLWRPPVRLQLMRYLPDHLRLRLQIVSRMRQQAYSRTV